ncbi:lectin [Lysobacter sp. 5GHs7-4]|uniref:lectin n=1 Tax=Lysobacter sp. 5GHs7-4 TaxID=2904253 RepID=UPI001E2B3AAE|nr:lectin [Lysobacter sp. 5GHs7-4]UHQ22741.1 lectin [Lysobacter sp. 5GHs7-4]
MKSRSNPILSGALALCVLGLSACTDRPNPQTSSPLDPPAPIDQPAEDVPPATAPAAPPPAQDATARMDGYAALKLGMSAEDARKALGASATGKADEPGGCYYLEPPTATGAPNYMIEGDKFVRYENHRDAAIAAPGGGKIGMSADEIRALYPGRIEERPHKYVDDGQYWRIQDAGGGSGVLLFEVIAGKVTAWRVGLAPQVDYVEGCS